MKTSPRLAQLQQFLAAQPNDAFLLYAMAMEYHQMGAHAEAADYYAQLLQQHPDYVGLYYHYGQLQLLRGDAAAAEQLYRSGIVVATRMGDRHAAAELRQALAALLGVDEEDLA